MSQEDLAKKVGVRRETIGNLENGRYNPSLVLAMHIAEVFGVTVDELFQLVKESDL
jgi:putative transcriptional regulator